MYDLSYDNHSHFKGIPFWGAELFILNVLIFADGYKSIKMLKLNRNAPLFPSKRIRIRIIFI